MEKPRRLQKKDLLVRVGLFASLSFTAACGSQREGTQTPDNLSASATHVSVSEPIKTTISPYPSRKETLCSVPGQPIDIYYVNKKDEADAEALQHDIENLCADGRTVTAINQTVPFRQMTPQPGHEVLYYTKPQQP